MPYPSVVPVNCSASRRYHNSDISGSPLNEHAPPLTLHWIMVSPPWRYVRPLEDSCDAAIPILATFHDHTAASTRSQAMVGPRR